MKRSRISVPSSGFTLIELLVTITIIAILIGLAASGASAVRQNAMRTEAASNMRMIGIALTSFTTDHDGFLPGPLWPGQVPQLDPGREGRLVRELAPYLGIQNPTEPELIEVFIPPAYRSRVSESALESSRTFVMNMAVLNSSATALENPWGSSVPSVGGLPGKLMRFSGMDWALSDADQLHPRVSSAPWSGNTPDEIIHGDKRLALFFDGHVAPIDEADLITPTVP